ncbi:MAG: ABC transporter permease [Vicinamibacterales bacterium]
MYKLLESAGIALDAIWASKLRSLMTVLGNIVAVTSIIAVVSLIQGLNASVTSAIMSQAGADAFSIQQYPVTRSDEEFEAVRSNPRITMQDVRAIRRYSDQVSAVMAESTGNGRVTYRDKSIDSTRVQGVTSDYIEFSTFDAERGRLMSPTEVDTARPVCVLGWRTADRLFGTAEDPLDKTIQVEGIHFRVLGVSSKRGSILGQSQDEFIVMPLGQFQQLFGSRRSLSLTVKPRNLSNIATVMDEATVALRSSRGLKPKQRDNFGMFTSDTILDIYHQATNGIFAVLVGVVALSLVVGGIVIMNIMLMAVSERTREIGLRKALGARRVDILAQMLTESVVLSVFGGVIGTVFGSAIATAIASFTPIPASVELWSVALGIFVTAFVGLFFGLYPASRAASLDPIEALRRE